MVIVDNIKLNKIRSSLFPAFRVKRTDPRGRNKPQTPSKDSFERKKKKNKKEDSEQVMESGSENINDIKRPGRQTAETDDGKCSQSDNASQNKVIDILV